jgi:D-xylose transport system ATP-binding protein
MSLPAGGDVQPGAPVTRTGAASLAPLVEMRDIEVSFGGVRAVDRVSVDLHRGEVVGLLGHNGAGKSTLVRVLSGACPCDAGEIRIDGAPVEIRSPREARAAGIETIYQTLALADGLNAARNLFLGRELTGALGFVDDRAMQAATRAVMARLNPGFTRFDLPVRALSGGQRQSVAIARAVHFDARVLVMDEPTAALGPEETRMVADLVGRLRAEGLGIFLISHDIREVMALCDRVSVMKNGRLVGTVQVAEVSEDDILAMIVLGRPPGGRMQ